MHKKHMPSDDTPKCTIFDSLVILVFITLATTATPARSEDYKASDDLYNLSLEKLLSIKVEVGSFFKEKTEDVGSTVSFINRDEWRKRGSKNVTQAIAHIPGVHQNTWADMENIVMRGYQRENSYSGVLFLVDNIPINSYAFSSGGQRIGLLDSYYQIEVIKGPGSTLYGSDAFSGLVSLKTWAPEFEITEANIEYGSFGHYGASFKHAQRFGNDVMASINIVAQGQNDEERKYDYLNFNGSTGNSTLENHRNANSIIAKISFKNTEFMAYNHHLFTRGGGFGFNLLGLDSDDNIIVVTNNGNQTDRHTDMLMFALTHKQSVNRNGEFIFKAYRWDAESFADYGTDAGPIGAGENLNVDQEEIRSGQDLKYLHKSNDNTFKFVAGLTYEEIETGDQSSFGVEGLIANERRIVKSVMYNADKMFADSKFKIIVGGRFDVFNDIDDDHFSPRLGLNYYHDKQNTLKVLYGNSFRAPNISEINGVPGGSIGGGDELKPESNDTYELIHIYKDVNFSLNSTIFYSVFENAISLSETLPYTYVNSAESRARGVEIESRYTKGGVGYYGSVSYVDSWVSEPSKDHSYYEGFPDWLINYGLQYKMNSMPLDIAIYNNHRYGAKTLDRALGAYVPNGKSIAPYVRTDVTVTYYLGSRNSNKHIYLNVLNLFNRDNYISTALASYKGDKDFGINAVVGFRTKY